NWAPPGGAQSPIRSAELPAALLLLVHLAQAPFGARPLERVPLAVEPRPQLLRLTLQTAAALPALANAPLAAIARLLAIARLGITRLGITRVAITRLGNNLAHRLRAAGVLALQDAVVVADVADTAAEIPEDTALLATVGAAATRDQPIARHSDIGAAALVAATRHALRRHRLRPADASHHDRGQRP